MSATRQIVIVYATDRFTYVKSSIMESNKSEHAPGANGQRQARISILT